MSNWFEQSLQNNALGVATEEYRLNPLTIKNDTGSIQPTGKITCYLSKQGDSPTGLIYGAIYDTDGNSNAELYQSSNSYDVNIIPEYSLGSYAAYEFNFSNASVPIDGYIGLKVVLTSSGLYIAAAVKQDPSPGNSYGKYNLSASWAAYTSAQLTILAETFTLPTGSRLPPPPITVRF